MASAGLARSARRMVAAVVAGGLASAAGGPQPRSGSAQADAAPPDAADPTHRRCRTRLGCHWSVRRWTGTGRRSRSSTTSTGIPVAIDAIAPAMQAAAVAIEDRRFYDEAGVDPIGTVRALVSNSLGSATQGGSTITQQYVKNYLINVVDRENPAAQRADRSDTLGRKVREAELATGIAHTMSKNDVLDGYLNVVEFSGNVYGVEAAAHAYFGTTAAALTVPQAALLAGMVNNPNLYDPYDHPQQAKDRRDVVIAAMAQVGSITPAQAAAATAAPLDVRPDGPVVPGGTCMAAAPDAGFFCQYAVDYLEKAGMTADRLATGGYTIRTTMDPAASAAAKAAVEANVPTRQNGVANTFAIVRPGHDGHEVVAMVANRNYGTDAAQGERATDIVASNTRPKGQEGHLVGREVGQPQPLREPADEAGRRQRERQDRAADEGGGLEHRDDAVAREVDDPGGGARRGEDERVDPVVLVHELHPGVVAEGHGDDREVEVVGDRGADPRADDVGEAQREDLGVGPAPGEPADVALDLDGVLAETAGRGALGPHVLGEHRGVARRGAVDGRGGLHDEAPHGAGLLAGREELHRPDDVDLLLRRAAPDERRRRDDVHVHDGVDARRLDDAGDHRVADVRADELDVADVVARRDDVDADDPRDGRLLAEPAREEATEIPGHPGHEHHRRHALLLHTGTVPHTGT